MNILPINNYNLNKNINLFSQKDRDNTFSLPKFGVTIPKQLTKDTVSFKATTNKVADKSWEITLDLARQIHNDMIEPQKKVMRFIKKNFDDLVASDAFPNDPIRKISSRVKSPLSIQEKSGSRKWKDFKEIENFMTDLIGVKFVIGESNRTIIDGVLDRFIPLIKSREVELYEIENKRPGELLYESPENQTKYDYASINMLEKMIRIQEEVWNGKKGTKNAKTVSYNLEDYQDSNYCAMHFLFKIPGKDSHIFELQIIGEDENLAKDDDDKVWKYINGKNIENKYKPLKELLRPLRDTSFFYDETPEYAEKIVEEARKRFDAYRADVFLFQRKKEPGAYSKKEKTVRFLPLQNRLFPAEIEQKYGINSEEFDFNNIHEIIKKCDKNAEISIKNLKKARAVLDAQKINKEITPENSKQLTKKQKHRYKTH